MKGQESLCGALMGSFKAAEVVWSDKAGVLPQSRPVAMAGAAQRSH